MNDKKQNEVKKLVNIIIKTYPNKYSIEYPAKAIRLANELLEHYQPKLHEDSIVLSKEEFDEVVNNAKNEMACVVARNLFDSIDWSKNTKLFETYILKLAEEYSMLIDIEEQTRKETAKEILQEINVYLVANSIPEMFSDDEFIISASLDECYGKLNELANNTVLR